MAPCRIPYSIQKVCSPEKSLSAIKTGEDYDFASETEDLLNFKYTSTGNMVNCNLPPVVIETKYFQREVSDINKKIKPSIEDILPSAHEKISGSRKRPRTKESENNISEKMLVNKGDEEGGGDKDQNFKEGATDEDEDRAFLLSLEPALKKLTGPKKSEFKATIFNTLRTFRNPAIIAVLK